MPKDADWLQKLFSEKREPAVIRGLNLALKLADPAKLPLMLWDVVAAQPKIDLAMQELSFLHFARFVPSWDGSALMVITEFDGPLEDYVLDFAIVIGDVFDKLLSYVESPPRLPIREYPSEFLLFVRQWNRVPFGPRQRDGGPSLLPRQFDFPIYQAYPDKTVLDIHPHRDKNKLLPPVADRPAAVVDLEDVQGNILKGYGAPRARHFFLHVHDTAAARIWLAREFCKPEGGYPWNGLSNAQPWPLKATAWDSEKFLPMKPAVAANIGFTWMGMQVLMPWRQTDLDKFPTAFREGATERAEHNGDKGNSAPAHWLFGKDNRFATSEDGDGAVQHAEDEGKSEPPDPQKRIHVVVSLFGFESGQSSAVFHEACELLRSDCEIHGMSIVHDRPSTSLPGGQEPFGYKDSIAQPRISGLAAFNHSADMQPAASPGEFLLGKDYASVYGGSSLRGLAEDLAQNGSFGVMRLIEQHKAAFDGVVNDGVQATGLSQDAVKARLMGRWPNGHPLSLYPVIPPSNGKPSNEFDYAPTWEYPRTLADDDGGRCPLGAHTRRMNPRSSRVPGLRHSRRLIRRGMQTRWHDEDKDGQKTEKVGLLGLFFCANLERQFEFIQRNWIQGSAVNGLRGSQDPIAGVRSECTRFQLGKTRDTIIDVPPLVTTRGCLYLFYPGLHMLDCLVAEPRHRAVTAPGRRHPLIPFQPLKSLQAVFKRAPEQLLQAALHRVADGLVDDKKLAEWQPKLEQWVPQLFPTRFAHGPADATTPQGLSPLLAPQPATPAPVAAASSAFIARPDKTFHALRTKGEQIIWVQEHRAYWVLSATLVKQVLENPDDFRQAPSTAQLRGIIRQDGDRHTVVRDVVTKAFDIAIKPLRTYLDDAMADVLPRLWQLDQFDFVREFAGPVPKRVFWRFFGLPADEVDACDALAQTMMRYYNLPDPAWDASRKTYADATVRLAGHLGRALARAWIADLKPGSDSPFAGTMIGEIARRTQVDLSELPVDSVIPPPLYRMHFPGQGERPLAALEALAVLMQMVLAGYMSTQFLLGSAMLNFLRADPRPGKGGLTPWQQLAALPADQRPGNLAIALDEVRRFDPPVAIVERYVIHDPADLLLHGSPPLRAMMATLRSQNKAPQAFKDCPVHAVVASANRDGPGLDQFHWDRKGHPNFSLGHGMHECIGRFLQNQVAHRAFEVLLDEFPELALCHPNATPAWLDNVYFRGLTTLSVTRVT